MEKKLEKSHSKSLLVLCEWTIPLALTLGVTL